VPENHIKFLDDANLSLNMLVLCADESQSGKLFGNKWYHQLSLTNAYDICLGIWYQREHL